MPRRQKSPTDAAATVSRNVRILRIRKGWNQTEFGQRAGAALNTTWTRQAVSSAEKGNRSWTANELASVAGLFGVAVGYLFDENECANCQGSPPAGFICGACGVDNTTPEGS